MTSFQLSLVSPPRAGMVIAGRYEIVRLLNASMIGWRVLALDSALDSVPVTVTLIYPHNAGDAETISRIQNELLTTRRLVHPNICQVFDFDFSASGVPFFSGEYLRGVTLRELIFGSEGPFGEQQATAILGPVANALAYAHRNGAIHGSIAPESIFVSESGSVKLTDFGLGRAMARSNGLTQTGETAFVPEYTAPEQLLSSEPDPQSDVYSFGCVAFELLTGKPPFRHESYCRLGEMHRAGNVQDTTLRSHAPDWLASLVLRCLKTDRAERPTADEISGALSDRAPSGTAALTASVRALRPERNNRFQPIAAFMFWLTIGVLSLVWLIDQNNWRYWPVRSLLNFEAVLHHRGLPMALAWPYRKIVGTRVSLIAPTENFSIEYSPRPADCHALIDAGFDPGARIGKGGITFVHWLASQPNETSCLKIVLQSDGKLANLQDSHGETPLHRAIFHGRTETARWLLFYGAALDIKNRSGETPVDFAFKRGDMVILDMVSRSSVGRIPYPQKSVLARAIEMRWPEAILCALGAPENQRPGEDGVTPVMLAAQMDLQVDDFIMWRLAGGVSLAPRDFRGRTALFYAVFGKSPRWVRYLAERGSDPNTYDQHGNTPLSYAIEQQSAELVELLLIFGADPNKPVASGSTPLDIAFARGSDEIVAMLRSYGAWARSADYFGDVS